MVGEETPKISLCPTKGLQPSKVDCTLSNFIEKIKLRKKIMDLSDRRRRDRIQIDVLKDIKEKKDIANDVVIFIDAIKDHLVQIVLNQDLNDLSQYVYHQPPISVPQFPYFKRVVGMTTQQLLILFKPSFMFAKMNYLVLSNDKATSKVCRNEA